MDGARTRDNGWSGQLNRAGATNGAQATDQVTVRVASRQSRIDEYPLTAPGGTTLDNPASGLI